MLKKVKLDTPLGSVIDVYKNPTEKEFKKIKKRFREVYPKHLIPHYQEPKKAIDEDGNRYFWMYGDATHEMIESQLRVGS